MSKLHHRRGLLYLACVSLICAIVIMCAGASPAQSGRRSGKTPDNKTTTAAQPKITLFVTIEGRNQSANIPFYLSDTALAACVDRLRDATDVSVGASARDMSREGAVNRAKSEKELYVVWLQLENDYNNPSKPTRSGPEQVYVRYTIFEPVTANVKAEGRTTHETYRTGGGGVSTRSSSRRSPIYSESDLKKAAREAADRVLKALQIDPPPESSPS
jgi:hypothetical protein